MEIFPFFIWDLLTTIAACLCECCHSWPIWGATTLWTLTFDLWRISIHLHCLRDVCIPTRLFRPFLRRSGHRLSGKPPFLFTLDCLWIASFYIHLWSFGGSSALLPSLPEGTTKPLPRFFLCGLYLISLTFIQLYLYFPWNMDLYWNTVYHYHCDYLCGIIYTDLLEHWDRFSGFTAEIQLF